MAPKDLGYFLLPNFNKQPTSVSAKARRRVGTQIETRWLWNLKFGIEAKRKRGAEGLIYVSRTRGKKGKTAEENHASRFELKSCTHSCVFYIVFVCRRLFS